MKTPEFYKHDAAGHIIPPRPQWADVAGLNYDKPQLRRYMIDILKHWGREFRLDGFPCDAAGLVPTDFWEEARNELDTVKPGLFMLAEWEAPALMARAFDVDFTWNGYHALADAVTGRVPAWTVRDQWQRDTAQYERGALRLRFSDNHDETRGISR